MLALRFAQQSLQLQLPLAVTAACQLSSLRQLSTTPVARGLEELIVTPPPKPKEGEKPPEEPTYGRAWKAAELRQKSWDDLHKLWFVLLKERNRLHSEKLMYKAQKQPMPNPRRISKVRLSMNRIKQVLSERLNEHEDPHIRMQLKNVIDAL